MKVPVNAKRVYIIAEAGVNHNGVFVLAKKLVRAAADAGADAVKFQAFRADALATAEAKKAFYQKKTTGRKGSQLQMLKALELDEAAHLKLKTYAKQLRLDFLSSPFDEESARMLIQKIGVRRLKVPSGEITNAPLLLELASSGLPVILSTGMSTLEEIREALGVLAFGYTRAVSQKPSRVAFQKAFKSRRGQALIQKKVTLLQCTTEYPAPYDEVHLRAMDSLKDEFRVAVGLSDHTPGFVVSIAAAARGAEVIEKHLTLDRSMEGPDHRVSLEPAEFKQMVQAVRLVERALGSAQKKVTPSEQKNRPIARKSLVAARRIRAGELFSEGDLAAKRSGPGISPVRYWDLLGKAARKNYAAGERIAS